MSLSNLVPGKRNSIEQSAGEPPVPGDGRPSYAPTFTSEHGPQPNSVIGERLQAPQRPPRRDASRTLAEARAIG
ncbi:hypothetical protein [Mycobacterium sp. 852002-50816_SCH5313054-b]|uniref:hypothetical protein n=1 Tax=Mycobacterium sp. 852002-50816_SCH5313054-b TaxID=1834092 RepID=UPI000AD21F54|nr:hypothetical protein [Mycobacterium sp. 852002-50816_SCH5313054-b]